jgi:hypothetical protein
MNFLEKISLFNKYAIKGKLISLGKILGISLYPNLIYKIGIKKIYSNFIFNLLAKEKFKKIKKRNYDKIFSKKYSSKKINHLVALPRSGSNLLRNLLTSYVELYFKFGNGIPKYDGINDKWYRTNSTIVSGDLQNAITFNNQEYSDITSVINEEEFEQKKIVFSRHPLQKCNLYNISEGKLLIIIRNPKDQIKSEYLVRKKISKMFKLKEHNKELDNSLLKKIVFQNKIFYNFWKNFIKNKIKNKDFITINFNELQNSTKDILVKILEFYEYKIDHEHIDSTIKINSKESYENHFGTRSKNSIRFVENININENEIEENLKNYDIKTIIKDYEELSKT